jgi:uncharacterized RDD family membrane protein YckC
MELTPCNYGKRALAYIIDVLFVIVPAIGGAIIAIVLLFSDALRSFGVLLAVLSLLWILGAGIWNQIIRQGKTGQTVGKSRQQIQLVSAKTGSTPGVGIVFIRVFVAYVFNALTGGLFMIVDLLFPAFDKKKQRIMDKICGTLVVDINQSAPSTVATTGVSWAAPTHQASSDPLN